MRESYRDKRNRQARIAREKEEYMDRRKEQRRKEDRRSEENENSYEDIVAGRNAVLELLKSEKDINKLFIERGERHGSINEIITKAKEAKVVIDDKWDKNFSILSGIVNVNGLLVKLIIVF